MPVLPGKADRSVCKIPEGTVRDEADWWVDRSVCRIPERVPEADTVKGDTGIRLEVHEDRELREKGRGRLT